MADETNRRSKTVGPSGGRPKPVRVTEAVVEVPAEPAPDLAAVPEPAVGDESGAGSVQWWTPRPVRIAVTLGAAAVFTLVTALVGYAWSARGDDVFAASADVRYRAIDDPGFEAVDRALQAQLRAITGRGVLVPAGEALDLDPDDLADRVSATLISDSDVLRIEARAATTTEAERILTSIIDIYVARVDAENPESDQAYLAQQLAELDLRIADISTDLRDPDLDPVSAATVQLETEYAALLDQRTALVEMAAAIQVADLEAPRVEVLAEAYADPDPVEPRPARAALVAGLSGALISVVGVYLALRRPALTHP